MAQRIPVSSPYETLLEIVRNQIATAQAGDLDAAVEFMPVRQALIESAPAPSAADRPIIQEVLKLDRQLAGLIRERMLRIRDESAALQRGKTAMRGYATYRRPMGDRFEADC